MSLKNASFLALIGTCLVALVQLYYFFTTLTNIAQGVMAPVVLFSTLIHVVGSVTLAIFFFVFHQNQK